MIRPKGILKRAVPAVVAGMALFLFSCRPAVPPKKKPAIIKKETAEDLFFRAEDYFDTGQWEDALKWYKACLDMEPRGKRAPDCLLRIGDIHYKRGEFKEAFTTYATIKRDFPDYEKMPEAGYGSISCLYHMGALEQAIGEALDWTKQYPEHELRGHVALVLGKSYADLLHTAEAFKWFLVAETALSPIEPQEAGKIGQTIQGLIKEAEQQDLEQMQPMARGTTYEAVICYRLATIYYGEDELAKAREMVMQVFQAPEAEPWIPSAQQLLEKVALALAVNPYRIGCLLPLSGPFGIYGQEVLKGIELGMDIFSSTGEGSDLEVVLKDTQGDPQRAAILLEALVREDHVIAAIGPLRSQCAEAVVPVAEALEVPLITLCQKQDITEKGRMIFRNFMTPTREIESLVHVAMDRLSLKRFAIMYPDNHYGRFYMKLFWDKVEELGGEIRAAESYDPKQTDFAEQIKRMVGRYYPRPDEVVERIRLTRLPLEEESELDPTENDPIVDFEAVFIPDSAERVAMIAPQLVYHDVLDIWLLGTSVWQSPRLIPLAGDYLQGAIFTSGFFPDAEEDSVRQFVERYRTDYESEPGLLAATGYDTIRLLKGVILHGQVQTRRQFLEALSDWPEYSGVTGPISFDITGEVKKSPFLLTVLGKRLVRFP